MLKKYNKHKACRHNINSNCKNSLSSLLGLERTKHEKVMKVMKVVAKRSN